MSFICKYCNKTYKTMSSRSNHYRIYHKDDMSVKSKCEVSHSSVKSKSIVNQNKVNNTNCNNYICQYCNNIYKHKQSKYNHEKKCKYIYTQNINLATELQKENAEIKKENAEIKSMLNDIIKQFKIHPKTLQKINKQLINNGTINNTVNNINIVKFGTEDIASILSQSEILKILNRKMCSLEESIKAIHFNNNRPEFKNIYITNLKDQYAYIFDGTKFIAGLKSDILGELVDNHVENIEYSMDEYKGKLPPKTIEVLDKFLEKIYNEDVEFVDKEHKIKYPNFKQFKVNIIKLMIYNESESRTNVVNVMYDKIDN